MTTYKCPVCQRIWSMGPTRDYQELMCGVCARDALLENKDRHDALFQAFCREERQVEQILGKALGYLWFKDDQKNFPGTTEADGVCVGEHVPVTIAQEAADHIYALTTRIHGLQAEQDETIAYYAIRLELIQERAKQAYPADVRREIQDILALGYLPS